MFRRNLLFSEYAEFVANASSVVTGLPFSAVYGKNLGARGHASKWWISQADVDRLGVRIKDEETIFGCTFPNGTTFYNICQTNQEKMLEKYAGNVYPRWLLTGEPVGRELRAFLFSKLTGHVSNLWIRHEHIVKLGINPPKGSQVLERVKSSSDRSGEKALICNASSISEKVVSLLSGIWPRSAYTGMMYGEYVAFQLLRAALKQEFASNFWITKHMAAELSADLPKNAKAVKVVTGEGVSYLYNADQTPYPQVVCRFGYQSSTHPRNAITRKPYPDCVSSRLLERAARSKLPFSGIWLNKREAEIIGVSIYDFDDERCVKIEENNKSYHLYNSNITSNPEAVNNYVRLEARKNAPLDLTEELIRTRAD